MELNSRRLLYFLLSLFVGGLSQALSASNGDYSAYDDHTLYTMSSAGDHMATLELGARRFEFSGDDEGYWMAAYQSGDGNILLDLVQHSEVRRSENPDITAIEEDDAVRLNRLANRLARVVVAIRLGADEDRASRLYARLAEEAEGDVTVIAAAHTNAETMLMSIACGRKKDGVEQIPAISSMLQSGDLTLICPNDGESS